MLDEPVANLDPEAEEQVLATLKRLAEQGLYGAIIGKAYYTKAISLKEAIEVAK